MYELIDKFKDGKQQAGVNCFMCGKNYRVFADYAEERWPAGFEDKHEPYVCEECQKIEWITIVITAPEAEQLWGLRPGTVRRACRESRIAARRSAGTWLTTRGEMIKKYGNQPLKKEGKNNDTKRIFTNRI